MDLVPPQFPECEMTTMGSAEDIDIYVCMYVCMHVCIYIKIYIYIYIYIERERARERASAHEGAERRDFVVALITDYGAVPGVRDGDGFG